MERIEIYFDKSRFIYLGHESKDLVDLTNKTIAQLKWKKLLYLPVNMELLNDMLHDGTLITETLKTKLEEQKNAVSVLLQSATEGTIERLQDEAKEVLTEFKNVAWRGNDRYPMADRLQCIKVVNGVFEYDEDKCKELCKVYIENEEAKEVYDRVLQLIDQANELEQEIFEKSNKSLHLFNFGQNVNSLVTQKWEQDKYINSPLFGFVFYPEDFKFLY